MGTHPIFESDFDCLTDMSRMLQKTRPQRRLSREGTPETPAPSSSRTAPAGQKRALLAAMRTTWKRVNDNVNCNTATTKLAQLYGDLIRVTLATAHGLRGQAALVAVTDSAIEAAQAQGYDPMPGSPEAAPTTTTAPTLTEIPRHQIIHDETHNPVNLEDLMVSTTPRRMSRHPDSPNSIDRPRFIPGSSEELTESTTEDEDEELEIVDPVPTDQPDPDLTNRAAALTASTSERLAKLDAELSDAKDQIKWLQRFVNEPNGPEHAKQWLAWGESIFQEAGKRVVMDAFDRKPVIKRVWKALSSKIRDEMKKLI